MSVFNRGTNIIIQADPGIYIRQGIAAAEAAEASAEAAANSAESAATDNFRTLRDVATLLANTSIVYGAGAAQVAAGDIMQTRAEGFSYEVAPEAATDQHVTTAGGVKLYVLPEGEGYNVKAFGALGDAVADDGPAIAAAITAAAAVGNIAFLPPGNFIHSTPFSLGAGAKLHGVGWGEQPLATGPVRSSVLRFTGSGSYALTITGNQAEALGFAMRDVNGNAAGAIRMNGDGNIIEGARVDVYINGFRGAGAWALDCDASITGAISGAVTYCDFKVRARSCANYFRIRDNNDGRPAPFGFVNSNTFHLICSGGETGASAPGYALYVEGGNNNVILPGSVLEPFETQNNHVRVVRGSLSGLLRVEGSSMPSTRLLVDIAAASEVTDLKFEPSTAYILNRSRSSTVRNRGAKSAQPMNPNFNLYKNPQFNENRDGVIADWTVTGAGVTFQSLASDFQKGFRTLAVTVPAGVVCTVVQPVPVLNTSYTFVSHGFWVKYDATTYPGGQANTSTGVAGGTAGSGVHTGDNTYQYLGQAVPYNPALPTNFQNRLNLVGGSGSTVFHVTCPTLCFGNEYPTFAQPLYTDVARIKVIDLATAHGGSNELTLPGDADTYIITTTTTPKTIARINNASGFLPVGQKVRLMFNSLSAGSTVAVSAFILGRANIIVDQHSVVDLVQDKIGLWRITGNY